MKGLLVIMTMGVGLAVLAGYFLPVLQPVTGTLLGWAVSLAGIAAWVGIMNMVGVHWRKMGAGQGKDGFSAVVILAFLATLGAGFYYKPGSAQFQKLVTGIQIPIETSLMAVLAFTLLYASLRLLQRRRDWMTFLFLVSAFIFLVIGSGLPSAMGGVPGVAAFLSGLDWLPVAGARALLIGIALGSLTTGLRILIGAHRPYGD